MIDLGNIKEIKYTPEELDRQAQTTNHLCPGCGKPMNVGEAESGFVCVQCYWESMTKGVQD